MRMLTHTLQNKTQGMGCQEQQQILHGGMGGLDSKTCPDAVTAAKNLGVTRPAASHETKDSFIAWPNFLKRVILLRVTGYSLDFFNWATASPGFSSAVLLISRHKPGRLFYCLTISFSPVSRVTLRSLNQVSIGVRLPDTPVSLKVHGSPGRTCPLVPPFLLNSASKSGQSPIGETSDEAKCVCSSG